MDLEQMKVIKDLAIDVIDCVGNKARPEEALLAVAYALAAGICSTSDSSKIDANYSKILEFVDITVKIMKEKRIYEETET